MVPATALLLTMTLISNLARAAEAPVGLGTATSYAVLAGTTVTNTVTPTVVNGDLGVSPGNSVTGFPPGIVNGVQHVADAAAGQAQSDLTTAYNDAASRATNTNLTSPGNIGGLTLVPGVYNASSSLNLTGTVTLNAQGDPNAVFIFKIASTLITAPASNVLLVNGAQACNVFWQVGSSATLDTNSFFKGNILALQSIGSEG
ncbi:ice-binding family protein [Streptomyces mirabilis]|uniref:ice-binding family protein n=1 Tax=Streptomyces mirabilis TaxID=68239 RepID=UPI00371CDB18